MTYDKALRACRFRVQYRTSLKHMFSVVCIVKKKWIVVNYFLLNLSYLPSLLFIRRCELTTKLCFQSINGSPHSWDRDIQFFWKQSFNWSFWKILYKTYILFSNYYIGKNNWRKITPCYLWGFRYLEESVIPVGYSDLFITNFFSYILCPLFWGLLWMCLIFLTNGVVLWVNRYLVSQSFFLCFCTSHQRRLL